MRRSACSGLLLCFLLPHSCILPFHTAVCASGANAAQEAPQHGVLQAPRARSLSSRDIRLDCSSQGGYSFSSFPVDQDIPPKFDIDVHGALSPASAGPTLPEVCQWSFSPRTPFGVVSMRLHSHGGGGFRNASFSAQGLQVVVGPWTVHDDGWAVFGGVTVTLRLNATAAALSSQPVARIWVEEAAPGQFPLNIPPPASHITCGDSGGNVSVVAGAAPRTLVPRWPGHLDMSHCSWALWAVNSSVITLNFSQALVDLPEQATLSMSAPGFRFAVSGSLRRSLFGHLGGAVTLPSPVLVELDSRLWKLANNTAGVSLPSGLAVQVLAPEVVADGAAGTAVHLCPSAESEIVAVGNEPVSILPQLPLQYAPGQACRWVLQTAGAGGANLRLDVGWFDIDTGSLNITSHGYVRTGSAQHPPHWNNVDEWAAPGPWVRDGRSVVLRSPVTIDFVAPASGGPGVGFNFTVSATHDQAWNDPQLQPADLVTCEQANRTLSVSMGNSARVQLAWPDGDFLSPAGANCTWIVSAPTPSVELQWQWLSLSPHATITLREGDGSLHVVRGQRTPWLFPKPPRSRRLLSPVRISYSSSSGVPSSGSGFSLLAKAAAELPTVVGPPPAGFVSACGGEVVTPPSPASSIFMPAWPEGLHAPSCSWTLHAQQGFDSLMLQVPAATAPSGSAAFLLVDAQGRSVALGDGVSVSPPLADGETLVTLRPPVHMHFSPGAAQDVGELAVQVQSVKPLAPANSSWIQLCQQDNASLAVDDSAWHYIVSGSPFGYANDARCKLELELSPQSQAQGLQAIELQLDSVALEPAADWLVVQDAVGTLGSQQVRGCFTGNGSGAVNASMLILPPVRLALLTDASTTAAGVRIRFRAVQGLAVSTAQAHPLLPAGSTESVEACRQACTMGSEGALCAAAVSPTASPSPTATATPSTSPSPTISSTASASPQPSGSASPSPGEVDPGTTGSEQQGGEVDGGSGSLSTGAMSGIAMGCVFLLAAIAAGMWWRRKQQQGKAPVSVPNKGGSNGTAAGHVNPMHNARGADSFTPP